jgi:hypothetical protein
MSTRRADHNSGNMHLLQHTPEPSPATRRSTGVRRKCRSGEKVHNPTVATTSPSAKSRSGHNDGSRRRPQEYKESTSNKSTILPWQRPPTTTGVQGVDERRKSTAYRVAKRRSAVSTTRAQSTGVRSTGVRRPRGHLSSLLGGASNTTINQDEEPLPIKGPR